MPRANDVVAGFEPQHWLPAKPATLAAGASAVWDDVVPTLFAAGVLSQLDAGCLEAYCRALDRYRRAVAEVEATGGEVVSINGDPKENPWLRVAGKSAAEVLALARNLGLCPGAPIRGRGE